MFYFSNNTLAGKIYFLFRKNLPEIKEYATVHLSMDSILGQDFQTIVKVLSLIKPDGYYVYRWRREDDWLYIGSTHSIHTRLINHKVINKVEPVQLQDMIEFFECPDKLTMLLMESALIAERQPKYNISGKKRGPKLTKEEQREQQNKIRAEFGLTPIGSAAAINEQHKL